VNSNFPGGQRSGARVCAKWRTCLPDQSQQRSRPELPKLHFTRWVRYS